MMTTPDFLYRYQSLSAYSLASLTNNTIWLAKPSTFNDPLDCALTLDPKKYKESIMHAVDFAKKQGMLKKLKREDIQNIWPRDNEIYESTREKLRQLFQGIGDCCVSAIPN